MLAGGGERARRALGVDVREGEGQGGGWGPRGASCGSISYFSHSFAATDDFPAQSGNRLTTLLCISHVVLLLLEDQFFCFTMSYTAM